MNSEARTHPTIQRITVSQSCEVLFSATVCLHVLLTYVVRGPCWNFSILVIPKEQLEVWSWTALSRELTFTWWGCCGLCLWHKPTELALSFLFCACVCICLSGWSHCDILYVSAGSPSRGEDVVVYVKDINQPSLPTSLYCVLAFISVFMTLSTVFHSINTLDNSPLSHFVLSVLFLPYWSFQLCISFWTSTSALK